MMRWLRFAVLLLASLFVQPAFAAFNIFACEPEWGSLAKELGGDKVNVYVATSPAAGSAPRRSAAKSDCARAER